MAMKYFKIQMPGSREELDELLDGNFTRFPTGRCVS